MNKTRKQFLIMSALFLGFSLSVSACGIKPKDVDPPTGAEGQFPSNYPKNVSQ